MTTSKPYTTNFMQYGEITVPSGVRLTHKTACGIDKNYHFVDQFDWVKTNYPQVASVLLIDLTYYGLNVPKEFVKY